MNRLIHWSIVLLAAGGCHRRHTLSNNPTTLPAPSGLTQYANTQHGIRLDYPAGWTVHPSDDYVLLLLPPGVDRPQTCSISLDIPDLPPHLPGMIRIGMIKDGYLDDLRKKAPDLKIVDDQPHPIDSATGRIIQTTWTSAGRPYSESVLLLIHKSDVFLIRSTSDTDHQSTARQVFEQIIGSIRWQ
ncbi:MAG: hypothetical protein IT447_02065 [Phycisphaerales bacterium]|jgi:hypothetical protein|nr:hypothetical protein [Phycisphaerales bacterium]